MIPRARVLRSAPPLLAVEWIDGARSPWQEYARPERFATRLAADLGAALARVHTTFAGRADDQGLGLPRLPRRPADFLSVHRPAPHELRRMSAGQAQIHRLIQSEPAIGRELDRACADWRAETLLHGDLRAANLLVLDDPGGGAKGLRLIDWELAKWGDPAWDLGCALADLVHFWVRGLPRDPSLPPACRAAGARVPLAAIQPAFAALWEGYRSRSGWGANGGESTGLLLRSVRCSAARLIQAAWQRCSGGASVAVPERALLQVAANLLADPVAAGRSLYGLNESQSAPRGGADPTEARR